MQRKATLGKQYEVLGKRISDALDSVNKLTETTPTPAYASAPDPNILKVLLEECEDSDFWKNFKKAAPIMFCVSVEEDINLKQMRDMSFIEELLKTKSILTLMNQKIKEGAVDIDIIEYAMATKMLEHKLAVLTALNVSVEGDGDDKVSFNIYGTNKSICIDKAKLREAIVIKDTPVVEKQATAEDAKGVELPNILTDGITEEEFLEKAIEIIGPIKKTPQKILEKDCFVKVFKYTGDFAKLKNKELKAASQAKRCEYFNKDHKAYLEALKSSIGDEEKAYESSSRVMFDKLCMTPELFERTQQTLMSDPYVSMELFNLGISMEQPTSGCPEDLTEDRTVDLVKESNNFAFDMFKNNYIDQMAMDPMMMPVLISAIAHDWVKVNHDIAEEPFKAALFKHKIYENPEVSQHMQMKQMELLQVCAQQNPMMMAQMMGGGMGGGPGMGLPF